MTADPVFPAIAAYNAAREVLWTAEDACSPFDAAAPALYDAETLAARHLLRTLPTTLAGVIALLRHVAECEAIGDAILATRMEDAPDLRAPTADDVLRSTLRTALERLDAGGAQA